MVVTSVCQRIYLKMKSLAFSRHKAARRVTLLVNRAPSRRLDFTQAQWENTPGMSAKNQGAGGSVAKGADSSEKLAALEAALRSKILLRAPTMAKILEYICLEHLAGRGDEIKEYNIAVEGLGRPPDFNVSRDSIVRVEVSRLRQRLARYYDTEGAGQSVRIVLVDSGYNPQFICQTPAAPVDPEGAGGPPEVVERVENSMSRLSFNGRTWLAIAVVATLVVALILWAFLRRAGSSTARATVPPVSSSVPSALPVVPGEEGVRISVGLLEPKYVDSSGHVWTGDRYFTGGRAVIRKDRRSFRTLDPALYEKAREGDFQYDIPLRPGLYELHLHFSEILYNETLDSSGVGLRRFNVILNGKTLLNGFDITVDAPGTNTADERVFRDVSPDKDGYLHLRFSSATPYKALLSGIEVLPGTPGKMRPVLILAAFRGRYDRAGQFWTADRYFQGGSILLRTPVDGTTDPDLFTGERTGNFSYYIPVATGRYTLTLRFAESSFGLDPIAGVPRSGVDLRSRLFDVYCNGTALLRDFDVLKEAAGRNRAVVRSFRGLKPNSQGKLVLSFVPVTTNATATIRAIEVVDEGV